MKVTKDRLWLVGAALLSIVIFAAGYLLLVAPQRDTAAANREKASSMETGNDSMSVKLEQLKAQYKDLPQRQAELAAIQQAIPETEGLSNLVRTLDQLATSSGVTLKSVTPGVPTLASPAPGPSAAGSSSQEVNPNGALSGLVAPTPGTTTAPSGPGASTLFRTPISLALSGGFFQTETFLKNLQTQMPRAMLVSRLQLDGHEQASSKAPGVAADTVARTKAGDVETSIEAAVFVLRFENAAGAGASAPTLTPGQLPGPSGTAPMNTPSAPRSGVTN